MLVFHYNSNHASLEVNHMAGEKFNSHDKDLEWVTGEENVHHAVKTGLLNNRGENSGNAILDTRRVMRICELLEAGKSEREILTEVDLSDCKDPGRAIRGIRERKAWRHISDDYYFDNRNERNIFLDYEVKTICKMLQDGHGYKSILAKLGYDVENMSSYELQNLCDVISNIRVGRYYSNISKDYNMISQEKERYDQIFTYEQIKYICSCLEIGMKTPEILKSMNLGKDQIGDKEYERHRHFVSRLKTKKIFIEISKDYNF